MSEKPLDYHDLNAMLNLYGQDGKLNFDADRKAAKQYFLDHVNQNTVFFHSLSEKLEYLVEKGYYEAEVLEQYPTEFLAQIWDAAFRKKFRFRTFLGAFKYYTSYTLKTRDGKRYLERYEDRIVMTALYLARGDQSLAMRMMNEMIEGRFQPATPTFLNAGKQARGELVSCFLLRIEDNMESIGRAINSALQLSKRGGGVALSLTNLREAGAPIKGIENQSSGVIPVMKLLEDSFSYANQLGARQGAGAVYLNAHHPDIMRFLDTKRENADEKVRIKTLSLGVVIPDITFELAKKGEDMYLFSPHDVQKIYGVAFSEISVSEKYHEMVDDKRIRKTKINARDFFQTIAEIQFESGYPYVMFEDTVNAANPIDGRITMSNLCVHGDTKILTEKGHVAIRDVVDTKQSVWNGTEFSVVDVVKTGTDKKLVRVTLSNGAYLDCTPEHKFYVQTGYVSSDRRNSKIKEVRAANLQEGQKLIKLDTPVIEGGEVLEKAYTNGFFTGDGCRVSADRGQDFDRIYLYGEKKALRDKIDHPVEDWTTGGQENRLISGRVQGLKAKFFVPDASYTVKSRLDWFAGLLDSDGSVCRNGTSKSAQIGSVNLPFLEEVRLMLQTLGVQSKVTLAREAGTYALPANDGTGGTKMYDCQVVHRLLVSGSGLKSLLDLGLDTHRLDFGTVSPNRNAEQFVKIVSVVELEGEHDTFCFTEPKRHLGVFNGVLTGQCSEILQVSEASTYHENLDYDHIGVDISCNLGSMNIARAMDGGDLGTSVETAIRALTAVSEQSNINSVPSIVRGNAEGHAIGLGQMNLHGFLARERIHYDSPEAVDFTSAYFAAVLFHALRASNAIAREKGEKFAGFEKSKYADGSFFEKYVSRDWLPETETVKGLFEKFGVAAPTREDWSELKASVMKDGLYNRNLQAVPPTGSISYINDSTSSIHPIASKIEIRKEGKIGRVYYPAPFMDNDNIEFYRDAYEIGPNAIIDVYAAATEHVDQGLSLTLFFPAEVTTRDINKAQIYAWKKGIKTIYYVRLRQTVLGGTEVEGCVSCSL